MGKMHRISAVCLVLLTSCLFETKFENPNQPGYLSLELNLKPSVNALFKVASADTLFSLDSLKVILTSPNTATISYTYPISGRADTGDITVSTKIYALASLRTWQAKLIVLDTTMNPSKTDTVYLDSVSFDVKPSDTTLVNKTASPSFSILRSRLVSNSPASITNNVKWVRLRVDGVMQDSMQVGPTLRGISFGNASTGVTVGDAGLILRTTNSAVNWAEITSGTTQTLNAVSFPAVSTGYAVGNAGTILKTTTGTSWSAQTSGTTQTLNGTHFSGTSAGYAVGSAGTIKISNGTTWTNPTTNPATQDLNGVFAASGTVGYAVGNGGTIMKTSNTGVLWATQTSGTTRNLNAVYFRSATAGYAVGDSGVILKTTNGTAWSALTSGTTKNLTGVYFTSNTIGYAVGEGGILLRTTDATAWTVVTSGTSQNLTAVWWSTNGSVGTLIGEVGSMVTSANGTTWTKKSVGTKSFDMLLTYKYLKPNVSHTLLMDAIDTLSGPLRGYQASKTVLLTPGKDTTVTPNASLTKCGYSGFPSCL